MTDSAKPSRVDSERHTAIITANLRRIEEALPLKPLADENQPPSPAVSQQSDHELPAPHTGAKRPLEADS